MIRLIAPFLFLGVLTAYSYFFIEKPAYEKAKELNFKAFELRDFKPIKIYAKNFTLELDTTLKEWFFLKGKESLDQKKIISFLSRMKKIRFEKPLKGEGSHLDFLHQVKVEDIDGNTYEIEVGQKQLFSEKFYIRVSKNEENSRTYLVKDESPQVKPIPDELFDVNPYKRYALIQFMISVKEDLLNPLIFTNGADRVKFNRAGNRSFSIDVEKMNINSLGGHIYQFDKSKIKSWSVLIKNLEAKKSILRMDFPMTLFQQYGDLVFNTGEKSIRYQVFIPKNNKKSEIAVLDETNLNYIKIMDIESLSIIFPYMQDFVDKKVFELKNRKMNISFESNRTKRFNFEAEVMGDSLIFKSDYLNNEDLKELGELTKILFYEADYVNFGNEMTILPEKSFELLINDRSFSIGHAHGVVEVYDTKNKLSFFHRKDQLNKLFKKISL